MGPWNTGTVVLDLVDPEGTGPPQVFAIDCNNLGISTKEQFRERSRVVAASTAPDGAIPPLPCRGFQPRPLLSRAWEEAFTTRAPGGFGMRMVSFIVKAFLPAKG